MSSKRTDFFLACPLSFYCCFEAWGGATAGLVSAWPPALMIERMGMNSAMLDETDDELFFWRARAAPDSRADRLGAFSALPF